MEFDSIRPVLSGVVGGILATWLTTWWSRCLPQSYNRKSRELLQKLHRPAIWTANAFFYAGLFFGVGLYAFGDFADTDPAPLLWGFGLASILPILSISIVSALTGRDIREAYVAFSWGQGSPLWATYGLLGAGVVAFGFAVASLGT